jgi:hypothetical protein
MNRNPETRAPFDPAKLARDRNNLALETPAIPPPLTDEAVVRARPARLWDVRPLMRMTRLSAPVKGRGE